MPSWFLQNYEYFFSELLRELLALFDRYATLMDGKPASPPQLRRVFAMAFEMCGGARRWLSLDCLAASTGAHAVLAVCNHCAADRLDLRAPTSIHRVACMDELARRILTEDPGSRDVLNAQRAFGYYAGSERWRTFAAQCACWRDGSQTKWVRPPRKRGDPRVRRAAGAQPGRAQDDAQAQARVGARAGASRSSSRRSTRRRRPRRRRRAPT